MSKIREVEANGIGVEYDYEELTDTLIERRVQDVEPILTHNKALANHDDGYTPSRDMRRVASIPLVVVEQWMKEGVDIFDPNCREEVRKRLNSSDYAYLRTAPGKL